MNLSKGGVSTSFGPKGAKVTIGKKGAYLHTGIPGTGLYSRKKISASKNMNKNANTKKERLMGNTTENDTFLMPKNTWGCVFRWLGMIAIIYLVVNLIKLIIGSFDYSRDHMTALRFWGFIATIFIIVYLRRFISFIRRFTTNRHRPKISPLKSYTAEEIKNKISEEKDEKRKLFLIGLETLCNKEKADEKIIIGDTLTDKQRDTYKNMASSFDELCSCDKIWLIVSNTDNTEYKSLTSYSFTRRTVRFTHEIFNNVRTKDIIYVPTFNAGDFYYFFYPQCIVRAKARNTTEFDLFPISEVVIKYESHNFKEGPESSQLPNDSRVISFTYEKANMDGTPDLRFKDNRTIPIYEYGGINIETLKLKNMFSNARKAKAFTDTFAEHKAALICDSSQNKSDEPIERGSIYANNLDPLFEEAAHSIFISQSGSTSWLQRRFAIGYNRAERLMNQLEEFGIVGAAQGSTPRKVLINDIAYLDRLLSSLKDMHGHYSTEGNNLTRFTYSKENQRSTANINQEHEKHDTKKLHEPNPMIELQALIGLKEVKQEVSALTDFVKIQQEREKKGLKSVGLSYHCVFTGNPGTGKTTVARILAEIYKDLGILKKGHLVETDRSGLVAEYVGQTAVKTNKIIDSALDGVLFIDEAYSLVQGNGNDYGQEAISTLLKRMEDERNRLIVVLAGYSDEMKRFIDSNPGLQSRFTRYIHFADYTADELKQIFMLNVKKNQYTLEPDGEERLSEILDYAVEHKDKNFGNGRYVRNLFERTIQNQAIRLSCKASVTAEELSSLKAVDLKDNSMKEDNRSEEKETVLIKRKPRLNLDMIFNDQVPNEDGKFIVVLTDGSGNEVKDANNNLITAIYIGDNMFECRGERGSSSYLAKKYLNLYAGKNFQTINGNEYWTYKGKELSSLRKN